MKFDAILDVNASNMRDAARIAQVAESIGFDGLWTQEAKHNSFFPLVIAAEHTQRLELGTAIAVAFPRSPMVMAQIAWDLHALSKGRFILGIGTQVKAHIERRYGMIWDAPLPRIRDYIGALRDIWSSFQNGAKLRHDGDYYRFSLITPFFNPGALPYSAPPIYLAGVNEGLAQLAGELCEGFHVHPAHTLKYINEFVKPNIAKGAAKSERDTSAIQLTSSCFIITGNSAAEMDAERERVRQQIAFYLSTPTYRTIAEVHGWDEIGHELSRRAAAQRWNEMGALIDDNMLHEFATEAPLHALGATLKQRYSGVLDRIADYKAFTPSANDDEWRDAIRQTR